MPDSILKYAVESFGSETLKDAMKNFEEGVKIGDNVKSGLRLVCRGVTAYDRFNDRANGNPYTCWQKTASRGVGKPIRVCRDDKVKSGLLCYPKCDAGFTGVGPVCW